MILKSKKTGKEKDFPDAVAKSLLSMPGSGFLYVGETPVIPVDDFKLIDGMTNAMIKKLNKKGIINFPQLFTICEKTKADIGITDEMLEQTAGFIRQSDLID